MRVSINATSSFPEMRNSPELASLSGCTERLNRHPVVSLRSTTGYPLGCLRHPFEGGLPFNSWLAPSRRGARLEARSPRNRGTDWRTAGQVLGLISDASVDPMASWSGSECSGGSRWGREGPQPYRWISLGEAGDAFTSVAGPCGRGWLRRPVRGASKSRVPGRRRWSA